MNYIYSILQYNFNNYEPFREPLFEIPKDVEYIYITDNKNIKSSKIKIIYDDELKNFSLFDKCYFIRFNIFRYCSSNICLYLDSSFQLQKNPYPIINAFIQSNCDVGLNVHEFRDNIYDEYKAWILFRNYNKNIAQKNLNFINQFNFDVKNYKGLYQCSCRIIKNTPLNNQIDSTTYGIMKLLSTEKDIDRLDQTFYSFVINHFFKKINIFPFSTSFYESKYLKNFMHTSNNILKRDLTAKYINTGYVLNSLRKLEKLENY